MIIEELPTITADAALTEEDVRNNIFEYLKKLLDNLERENSAVSHDASSVEIKLDTAVYHDSTITYAFVPLEDENKPEDDEVDSMLNQTLCSLPSTLTSNEGSTVNKETEASQAPIAHIEEEDTVTVEKIEYKQPFIAYFNDKNIIEENEEENHGESHLKNRSHFNIVQSWDNGNEVSMISEKPSQKETEDESYEKIWNQRKLLMEKDAEERAQKRLRDYNREGKTIEEIIDMTLKEYGEFYEMAHSVRLKFEEEKTKLLSTVQRMLGNAQTSNNSGGYGLFGAAQTTGTEFQYFLDDNDDDDEDDKRAQGHHAKKRRLESDQIAVKFSAPIAGKGRPFSLPSKV